MTDANDDRDMVWRQAPWNLLQQMIIFTIGRKCLELPCV